MDLRMDRAAIDYSDARSMMVDGQVRPNKVYDSRLLKAMRRLPRERFLPRELAPLAYVDDDVQLARGRVLLQPMVIARLIESAAIRTGETVLVVGAGAGYGAALLAECGGQVVALEEDPDLLALARAALPDLAPAVTLVGGPLASGCAARAPYDVVLIEGAVATVPANLASQLKPGGRVLAIRTSTGRLGHAVIGEAGPGGALSLRPIFDCSAHPIPSLQTPTGFVF